MTGLIMGRWWWQCSTVVLENARLVVATALRRAGNPRGDGAPIHCRIVRATANHPAPGLIRWDLTAMRKRHVSAVKGGTITVHCCRRDPAPGGDVNRDCRYAGYR